MNSNSKIIGERLSLKLTLLLFFFLSAVLFFITPASLHALISVNPDSEIKIGKEADIEIVKGIGLVKNKKLQNYINEIGQKLIYHMDDPVFKYHFKALDIPEVNAFALPGGYVYITRGMLSYLSSEAELATVLGHEIGHVTSHHGVKQMEKSIGATLLTIIGLVASQSARENPEAWIVATQTLSQHIISGYGREAEMQSDELGIVYAYDAGYDPRVVTDFFKKLKGMERFGGHAYHGFLASHPDTIERIITTASKSEAIVTSRNEKAVINKERYLSMIEGIPYGKSEQTLSKIAPFEIKVYEVKEKKEFKEVVNEVAGTTENSIESALLNGVMANTLLEAGERVKIIVKRSKSTANVKNSEE